MLMLKYPEYDPGFFRLARLPARNREREKKKRKKLIQ